jgi:outer membrane protein assembly factor BamB
MHSFLKRLAAVAVTLLFAGCGGGGASAPAIPSLPVQLSVSDATPQLVEGGANVDLTVTAGYSGTSDKPLIPSFQFDAAKFVQQGAIDASTPGKYAIHLRTVTGLAVGSYPGQFSFRLCQDSACAIVYPGSSQAANYTVKVALADWGTFQRNNAHNAYVHVTLDTAKFTQLWTWSRPAGDSEPVGGINTVATGKGMVYVSKDIYFGQADIYALKETDGSQAWHYASGRMASEGPPAFANGAVYFATTTADEQSRITALDAATGNFKFNMPYSSQWTAYFAPTIQGNSVLHTSNSLSSYSTLDGALNWAASTAAYDVTTPAADDARVYQYGSAGGGTLSVFDRISGATVATIRDPFFPGSSGYSEFAAPMLGSGHNVIAFSGGGFSGMAASNSEQYEKRVLVNYDIDKKAVAWRTADAYLTHPALGNGVIYAATSNSLDAISETDGQVLWSWALPGTDSSFHRNIVVTDNLAFISSDRAVYAIDLKTHLPVWQYPKGGNLAISGGGILYITVGARLSTGELVAIKLM